MSTDIVSWNIEGLASRLNEPGFVEYLSSFDICCLVETFTSENFDFSIYFDEYLVFHSPAIKLSSHGRRSGGAAILIKKSYSMKVTLIPCRQDNMVAVKISSPDGHDIVIICVYIPPTDSPYYRDKLIKCNLELLEELLLDIRRLNPDSSIVLCGDFNARIGKWNLHSDISEDDLDEVGYICLCPDYTANRESEDVHVNQFGEILMDLCRVHHMFVTNGSNKGDEHGKFTYVSQHGESVVDYCLVLNETKPLNLRVTVGSRIDSNHMPLEIRFVTETKTDKKLKYDTTSKIVWDKCKEEEVLNNLDSDIFKSSLNSATASISTCINKSVEIFTDALIHTINCMKHTFVSNNQVKHCHAEWFDVECKAAKQKTTRALRLYKKSSSQNDRSTYTQMRNVYKQLIREKKRNYLNNMQRNLMKNLNNTKEFWQVIRKFRKRIETPDIDIRMFKTHFENLLSQNINASRTMVVQDETDKDLQDYVLDAEITTQEVEVAITKVKHSKATGLDEIPGELIKLGGTRFLSFLTQLFNAMYDTQIFPSDWSKSVMVPIHKRGSTLDPQNYRGISLLSTLSKVFSSILTKRLQDWAEDKGKLCFEQAGFRKGHSTVDHVFTLHAIITNAVYGKGRGKFYVAFIDYEKAFDSVLHPCLWNILATSGVSTKFLNMLKSMHNNMQACIRWNGKTSTFFNCPIGTKQGAKESPILFSMYMNFVANFVRQNGKHGVQMQSGREELFFLIFADDVALFSTTPVGLQNQIDNLAKASKQIGLRVNKNKTKIMVFRRGGFLSHGEKWFLNGDELEVVNNLKYLGYTFTTKLSETVALNSVAIKAKQKTVSLLRTMWSLRTFDPKIFFRMYDAQVQPSLLYASELWGMKEHTSIERSHLFACKSLLGADTKAPNSLVYGETGRFPLIINSTVRAIKYWFKVLKMAEDRLPKQALLLLSKVNVHDERNWLHSIEKALCRSGFAYVWYNKGTQNERGFLKNFKIRLQDCYRQEWHDRINSSERFLLYSLFKRDFQCEKYLSTICITKFRTAFTRFRLGRNNLKSNTFSTEDKLCPFCKDTIEDEYHFLLECETYSEQRKKISLKIYQAHEKHEVYNAIPNRWARLSENEKCRHVYLLCNETSSTLF